MNRDFFVVIHDEKITVLDKKTHESCFLFVIGRILNNIILGDSISLYGGFGVFGPNFYRI